MRRSIGAGKPFYAYCRSRLHFPTVPNPAFAGKTGFGEFPDALAEMDAHVREILDAVDALGIRDNTIVVFTSDNGPEATWPWQGSSGPWRGYYFTHMEGSLRVPFELGAANWARAMPPGPDVSVKITEDYAAHVARDAFFWAWPLINIYNKRSAAEQSKELAYAGPVPSAPFNRIGMLTDYVAADERIVACPNQDVAYGGGSLGLEQSPVVIQVPDFGERFWVYQAVDLRTDGFVQLGTMYGTTPGFYMFAGPNWRGDVPKGISKLFRAPTNTGYVAPRIFMDDTAQDRAAIQPVLRQIMIYPLPKNDPKIKAVMTKAAADADEQLIKPLFQFRNWGQQLPHFWSTISNEAAFGTDYFTRTAVAKSNILINSPNETKYYYQDLDVSGARLNGANRYVVAFAKNQPPPVNGFWSLTLYNEHHFFAPNAIGRYSGGTKEQGFENGLRRYAYDLRAGRPSG